MRHLLALTALALAGTAAAQFQTGTTRWDGKRAARGDALLRATMLAEHNDARRAYGSTPLVWDEGLARDAARYAARLADRGTMAHDPQKGVIPRQGENLFMGTRTAYSFRTMARLWVDERRWFKKGRFPDVSTKKPASLVGHYTQIIWPSTERFGCALDANRKEDVLVCRYLPAGNYFGVELR